MERPDLSGIDPQIVAYIEALEAQLAQAERGPQASRAKREEPALDPAEDPTPIHLLTISRAGVAKHTPRHFYQRQRRGGMGIFDLETPEEDPPALLALIDVAATLLLFTSQGRCYRLALSQLPETAIHARGLAIPSLLPLRPEERLIAALPEDAADHVALVGERGWVSTVRRSFLGKTMIQGVSHYDAQQRGPLAAACWVGDGDDLFVVSRKGLAIRFPVQRVPRAGCLGLRLDRDDRVSAAAPVPDDESGVLLVTDDGKGTIRAMAGFRSNKMPGGQGKAALKAEAVVAAAAVKPTDDIFVISRNAKLIRFAAAEIPPKEGVVQGVSLMALRGDEVVAAAVAAL